VYKSTSSSMLRSNSFNQIRLILAFVVLLGHSGVTSGNDFKFAIGEINLRDLSVFCFFILSGYLISPGLIQGGVRTYLIRRFARIYPGYFGVILAVSFGFSRLWQELKPLSSFNLSNQINYFLFNLLPPPGMFNQESMMVDFLAGQPDGAIMKGNSNASLWTLTLETVMYLGLALIFSFAMFAQKSFRIIICWTVILVYFCSVTSAILMPTYHQPNPNVFESILLKWPYILSFIFGVYLSFVKKLKFNSYFVNILLFILLLISTTKPFFFAIFGIFCLGILVINFGESSTLSKVSLRLDISYGVYLYHFPVQQTLAHFAPVRENLVLFISLSILFSSALAYLSARFIEGPAQRKTKKWVTNRDSNQ